MLLDCNCSQIPYWILVVAVVLLSIVSQIVVVETVLLWKCKTSKSPKQLFWEMRKYEIITIIIINKILLL